LTKLRSCVQIYQIEKGMLGFVMTFLQDFFQQQIDAGKFRQTDTLQIAQVYLSCMMGFVLRRQVLRDPVALSYTHEQIADAVLEVFLPGLLPS
jgi:hypothetical protein